MSRPTRGPWGGEVEADVLAPALVAAGVLAGAWRRARPPVEARDADGVMALLDEVVEAAEAARAPVTWRDPFTRAHWGDTQRWLHPTRAADLWSHRSSGPPRLALHGRDLTAGAWRPAELTRLLTSPAGQARSAFVATPEPGRRDRLSWDWPLRVGVPDQPDAAGLREQLADAGSAVEWMGTLIEPVTVGRRRHTADLLVLPGTAERWRTWLPLTRPRADMVLLLTTEPDLDGEAALLRTTTAAAVTGVVRLDPTGHVSWLIDLIRSLSHDQALDEAMAYGWQRNGAGGGVLFAAPSTIAATRLRALMASAAVELEAVDLIADEPVALPPAAGEIRYFMEPEPPLVGAGPPRVGAEPPVAFARIGRAIGEARHSDGFIHETGGASRYASARRATRAAAEDAGPIRYVQAAVRRGRRVVPTFLAGAAHEIRAFVGPPEAEAVVAPRPFPDETLPDAPSHRLTVVLASADLPGDPEVREIELPRVGRSDDAVFDVTIPAGPDRFEARLIVLHGNRILQTWLLRGPVVTRAGAARETGADAETPEDAIVLAPEAMLRMRTTDLHRRRPFDAALVLNHGHDGVARGTVTAGHESRTVNLDSDAVKAEVKKLRGRLEEVIDAPDEFDSLDDARFVELLVFLANRGVNLRSAIVDDALGDMLGDARRLQVLSAVPEAYLPLEFCYDLPAPDRDATVCATGRARLADPLDTTYPDEVAGQPCPGPHDATTVCPLGFWGLNRVIERQLFSIGEADRPAQGWRVSEPAGEGALLPLARPLLFAASDRVDGFVPGAIDSVRQQLAALAGPDAETVVTWDDWCARVRDDRPGLLVALPHTFEDDLLGVSLSIGDDQNLASSHLTADYVHATGDESPVAVLLLGCSTAASDITFEHFPAKFRGGGAAVVLGTLTKVLGRHAAPVAAALVTRMLQTPPDGGASLGEALVETRRALLDGTTAMVLALVAYGDADWILEGR